MVTSFHWHILKLPSNGHYGWVVGSDTYTCGISNKLNVLFYQDSHQPCWNETFLVDSVLGGNSTSAKMVAYLIWFLAV